MENQILELQYAMDTFYFLVCGALVMWMAAGFAMLEAGLVRAKNTTEILTKNVALFAISCGMYMICGYAIMYGGDIFISSIGNDGVVLPELATITAEYLGVTAEVFAELSQSDIESAAWNVAVLAESKEAGFSGDSVYSNASDFFFQVVFVATAMSIVSGAVAERMKLWAFLAFAVVMTGFIYPMEGSWTWNGADVFGLFNLGDLGFADFAGSGIVHMAGASAALAGVLVLGARKGKYNKDGSVNAIPGANLPMATLGTFILWMGWFGFNGGSVLKLGDMSSSNAVAIVFMNTLMAASGGVIGALVVARLWFKKADLTMALNGALAGLVAITASPDSSTALVATLVGLAGGIIVVFSIVGLDKVKIDDPVGAISVHGTVGLFGLLIASAIGEATFIGQLVGALTIFVWVFGASLVVWFIIKAIMGIRITEEEEYEGADIAECGQEAYPEFTGK
ncbi:ammonium transporter [Marinicellulosiphila megalodicopiae]|uniref:ammonium transporter n=1 Tax=Marinicellulosiphila megalodicopiae TaxID=2724896 RepID=UPI003BB20208